MFFLGGFVLIRNVIFLSLICIKLGIVNAEDLILLQETKEEKYNLSICAIFKNEAHYLKEWIEYHRLLGVDHFYLYNIGSRDFFQTVLLPYIKAGIVTLVNWPEALQYPGDDLAYQWALSVQVPAYENAVKFTAKDKTKWLVFLDIDEFLVCPEKKITTLLENYEGHVSISFSTDFFDAASQENTFSKKRLLIQTLDLTASPKPVVDKTIAKMIFKPDLCTGFLWPPYQCQFKEPYSSISLERKELRINCYLNKNSKIKKNKFRLNVDNRILHEDETNELLNSGYVIEDQERTIYNYVSDMLKKMGYSVK